MLETKIDRAVKAGSSVETNIAKADLAFSQIKKYQALVVRATLKRRGNEYGSRTSNRGTKTCVTVTYRVCQITGRVTSDHKRRDFYFEKLFTEEPGLSSVQFDTYLADFSSLESTEAARCEGRRTDGEN